MDFSADQLTLDADERPRRAFPLDSRIRLIQFGCPVTARWLDELASLLHDYPRIYLRVFLFAAEDLEFLRRFKWLKGFWADAFTLKDIRGFRHLSPELEFLAFGATQKKTHSLDFLQLFPNLRELRLEAHTRDFHHVSDLRRLASLELRSITLPDLSALLSLKQLRRLDIKLGGTTNLSLLPKVGRLQYLELWQVKDLCDLSPVGEIRHLQFLFLQSLRRVTKLPDFTKCRALRRIHLQNMKGLRDLSPLLTAKRLEDLVAWDFDALQPEEFAFLRRHPALKRVWITCRSKQRREAVQNLLGLPPADSITDDEFDFR